MSSTKKIWWTLALFLFIAPWREPLPAWGMAASRPIRVMILIDTSGSMRQNDPHRLSQAAAQLFLDLARPQDAVGLAAFSDRGVLLVPLMPLSSPAAKELFQSRLRSLTSNGQTTDLAAALEVGLSSFPPNTGESSHDLVLLLTDGKLDLGRRRRAEEPAVLAKIRQLLLPQYRQRDIALYTIAFTEKADRALLQEMAQATEGEFRFIKRAAMLHKAFGQLFILAHQAESLPLEQGTLFLDENVQETSLVLSKSDPQEQVFLITPRGVPISAGSTRAGVTWNSNPSYDLVRLTDPESGSWQVKGSSGIGESIAIIGTSTLSLQVEINPMYREVGEPIILSAFLQEKGQRIRDPQKMQQLSFRAEVTAPQGDTITLPLEPQGEGMFTATLATLREPGRYDLVVMAASPTLRRQRTLSFTVHPLCFRPSVSTAAPVTASVTLIDTCPPFLQLVLEAGHSTGDGSTTWMPLASPRPGFFQATIPSPPPGQIGLVTIRIRGRLEGGEPFVLMKGPWSLPASPLPPPRTYWWGGGMTVVRKLLLNGVLVLIGGSGFGFFLWRARRAQRHLHAKVAALRRVREGRPEATSSLLTQEETGNILPSSVTDPEERLRKINTSMQYASDNVRFLQDSFYDLRALLEEYTALLQAAKDNVVTETLIRKTETTAEELDAAYLLEEIPRATQQALEGIESIAKITRR